MLNILFLFVTIFSSDIVICPELKEFVNNRSLILNLAGRDIEDKEEQSSRKSAYIDCDKVSSGKYVVFGHLYSEKEYKENKTGLFAEGINNVPKIAVYDTASKKLKLIKITSSGIKEEELIQTGIFPFPKWKNKNELMYSNGKILYSYSVVNNDSKKNKILFTSTYNVKTGHSNGNHIALTLNEPTGEAIYWFDINFAKRNKVTFKKEGDTIIDRINTMPFLTANDIFFVAGQQIYKANKQTNEVKHVSLGVGTFFKPALTKNGKYLVYLMCKGGNCNIYSLENETNIIKQLTFTEGEGVEYFSISDSNEYSGIVYEYKKNLYLTSVDCIKSDANSCNFQLTTSGRYQYPEIQPMSY